MALRWQYSAARTLSSQTKRTAPGKCCRSSTSAEDARMVKESPLRPVSTVTPSMGYSLLGHQHALINARSRVREMRKGASRFSLRILPITAQTEFCTRDRSPNFANSRQLPSTILHLATVSPPL